MIYLLPIIVSIKKVHLHMTSKHLSLDEMTWISKGQDSQGVIGITEVGQYLQLWLGIQNITLNDEPDQLLWEWTADGTYSSHSAYLATFHRSMMCYWWKLIWKTWVPPRVKFFHGLANLDMCWTTERLARHGLQHRTRCPLCDQAP
jgi:hypothetical protein